MKKILFLVLTFFLLGGSVMWANTSKLTADAEVEKSYDPTRPYKQTVKIYLRETNELLYEETFCATEAERLDVYQRIFEPYEGIVDFFELYIVKFTDHGPC